MYTPMRPMIYIPDAQLAAARNKKKTDKHPPRLKQFEPSEPVQPTPKKTKPDGQPK
jgi:hypothetical protein